jgi:hypothetical protein
MVAEEAYFSEIQVFDLSKEPPPDPTNHPHQYPRPSLRYGVLMADQDEWQARSDSNASQIDSGPGAKLQTLMWQRKGRA